MIYTVEDICRFMEDLAPLSAAETWDNVGLLLGDPASEVKHITLALDLDDAALTMAKQHDSDLIITHHPVIFPSLNRLTTGEPMTRRLLEAAKQGIAVYSAHTNLDCAPGGVNDALAAVLGITVEESIHPIEGDSDQAYLRSDAMAERLQGSYDIPDVEFGHGRIGRIPGEHVTRRGMVRIVNNQLQTGGCILNFDTDAPVSKIAVAGGSFDEDWIPELVAKQVNLLISGEIKHHVMLRLSELGIAAIIAGHEMTERVILYPLANYLSLRGAELSFAIHTGLDYNKIVF